MRHIVQQLAHLGGVDLKPYNRAFEALRRKFQDYTMVQVPTFVRNLELCNAYRDVEGDFVECGTWRGGMCAAIAEVLGPERKVHLFDSFEGLPQAQGIDGPAALEWQQNKNGTYYYDNCCAEERFVHEAMRLANRSKYAVYKGWFDQTLSTYPGNPIAILRLDGDWYKSILVCLEHLFPHVVPGGLIILDDYKAWDGCARAVHDYLSRSKSPSRIREFRDSVSYLVKTP
jgi:O-methyltransferase